VGKPVWVRLPPSAQRTVCTELPGNY